MTVHGPARADPRPTRERPHPGPVIRLVGTLAAVFACGCSTPEPQEVLPSDIVIHLRGHEEMVLVPDGPPLPWLLTEGKTVEVCLQTSTETPTTLWQASLWLEGEGMEPPIETLPADPTSRLGTTLCFSFSVPSAAIRHQEALCGRIRDGYDGATFSLPCQAVIVGGDEGPRHRLEEVLAGILRHPSRDGPGALSVHLDRLAGEARSTDLPFLATRIDLVALHFLRQEGSPDSLARAAERLARPPAWIDDRVAVGWRIKWEYERALLALARGWDLRSAWRHLAVADEQCARVLHPTRLTVRMKQAEILARVGALGEAIDRLETALDDCATMPCRRTLMPSAHGALGWFLTLDPLADSVALERARDHLGQALAGAQGDPLEVANQQINLAYLALRQNDSQVATTRPPLTKTVNEALSPARAALADPRLEGARFDLLMGWTHLVDGLSHLATGHAVDALEACGKARRAGLPRLAAWAAECQGRAQRLRGDLDEARQSFESAMLLHQYATPERLGQVLALGPGRRAETFYRAARLEIEDGDPKTAWALLERLDRLADEDTEEPDCKSDEEAEERGHPDNRREVLLQALARLDAPASGRERRQRVSMQRALREELEELARRRNRCAQRTETMMASQTVDTPGTGPHLRIFAIEDEILVLTHGGGSGDPGLLARRRWPRIERIPWLSELGRALDGRRLGDEAWRRSLAPAVGALALDTWPSGPSTLAVALHGELQGLPLAALPLPGGGWLGERQTPAIWAGSRPRPLIPLRPRTVTTVPLLVVDPQGDLPAGRNLAETYHALFPDAQILLGTTADRGAFREALPNARWLHVDSHAQYDPAFPELSSLLLADGPFTLAELGELSGPLDFANLSGCRTGRWPITADSGHFGLAGRLVQRGARWAVATRSDLDDAVAGNYNHVFYPALAAGATVPEAHAQAMAEVRSHHPAAAWASLFLLQGNEGIPASELKKPLPPTPYPDEREIRRGAPRGDATNHEARAASTGEGR